MEDTDTIFKLETKIGENGKITYVFKVLFSKMFVLTIAHT